MSNKKYFGIFSVVKGSQHIFQLLKISFITFVLQTTLLYIYWSLSNETPIRLTENISVQDMASLLCDLKQKEVKTRFRRIIPP